MSEISSSVEYREIPGFPGYRVGDDGSLWSQWRRGQTSRHRDWIQMKASWNWAPGHISSRLLVKLRQHGASVNKKVHRLVLESFVGPCPIGMVGCHNDGNTSNNRLTNLRWGTPSNNAQDSLRHGTFVVGERHHFSKITAASAKMIRDEYLLGGTSYRKLGLKYGLDVNSVFNIVKRKTWKHVA